MPNMGDKDLGDNELVYLMNRRRADKNGPIYQNEQAQEI